MVEYLKLALFKIISNTKTLYNDMWAQKESNHRSLAWGLYSKLILGRPCCILAMYRHLASLTLYTHILRCVMVMYGRVSIATLPVEAIRGSALYSCVCFPMPAVGEGDTTC